MNTIVWIHGDVLSPYGPALQSAPDAPAIFVWDDALLNQWQISLKRITFIYECLLELPVVIRRGDVAEQVTQFALEHDARRILTAESPSPRFRTICRSIADSMPIMLAKGQRASQATVASDRLASVGYCSSKNTFFHPSFMG